MKNLALKAKKRQESSSENEKSDDEEDLFALITRGLKGTMRMRKRFKRFKPRNDYKGKPSSNFNSKIDKFACFECGSTKHLIQEFPKNKKEYYKKTKETSNDC